MTRSFDDTCIERHSESELSIAYGQMPILTYHYSSALYKPYFHPLHAPNGQVVTEDAPEDHVHHRGLCFAWGDVNGVNYWAETNCETAVRGRIQHREFREKSVNADGASLVVVNDWLAPDGTKPIEGDRPYYRSSTATRGAGD